MNIPRKFITALSEEEVNKLVKNHQNHQNFRVRHRSHAILMSFQGSSIDEIAKACRVDRDTVSRWIDDWNKSSFKGLEDNARSGRPKILTAAEEEQAFETAMKNPRFPARQLDEVVTEIGKQISVYTLKDLIKKKTTFGKESS